VKSRFAQKAYFHLLELKVSKSNNEQFNLELMFTIVILVNYKGCDIFSRKKNIIFDLIMNVRIIQAHIDIFWSTAVRNFIKKLKVVRIQQIFSLRIGAISAIFQFRLQQSWLMHIFCNVNALTASKVNNLGIFRRFIGRINTDK